MSDSKIQAQIGPVEFARRVESAGADHLQIISAMAETLNSLGYGQGMDMAHETLMKLWEAGNGGTNGVDEARPSGDRGADQIGENAS